MSLGVLIEAAIGLVAIYLALSIVVTAANDWVASITKIRASTLRRGVTRMLSESGRESLYASPLVRALGDDDPTWIPTDLFAGETLRQWLRAADLADAGLDDVRARLAELGDGDVPEPLRPLVALAGRGFETLDELEGRVGTWFDSVMQEASASYRRRMQVYGFGVGMVLCFLLNADTVRFVEAVVTDDGARAALAAWTEAYAGSGAVPTSIPTGLLGAIPLGWTQAAWNALMAGGTWTFLTKFFGLVATSLAVSLGAPFWFQILNSLGNLRGSGKSSRDPAA